MIEKMSLFFSFATTLLLPFNPIQASTVQSPQAFYSISGKVEQLSGAGLEGVRVSVQGTVLNGDTDADGNFTISSVSEGLHTLNIKCQSCSGQKFTPEDRQIDLLANTGNVNYLAIPDSTATFSIQGKATSPGGGNLESVNLTYGPGLWVLTDTEGGYIIPNLPEGPYTLTPDRTGYKFFPNEYTVNNLAADLIGRNYIGYVEGSTLFSISGEVLEKGEGLGEVTITYGQDMSVLTQSDGTYIIANLPENTYTLIPSKSEFTFSPVQKISVGPSQTSINFLATAISYSVSGNIRNSAGAGFKGAIIEVIQGSSVITTAVTGDDGAYTLSLKKGAYTIRPFASIAHFHVSKTDQSSELQINVGQNETGLNFLIEFDSYIPVVCKDLDKLVLYADDFKIDQGWDPQFLGSGTAGVQSGVYVLKLTELNHFAASLSPFSPKNLPDKGYDLRVKMNRVGSGDPSFGIVFDWKASNDFFLFQIDTDGQIYYIDHNGTVIANFDFSNKINTGEQVNELRVVRRQTTVDFYINGTLVVQGAPAPNLANSKGKVGVQLSTYSTVAEIHFTSFIIYELP